MENRHPQDLDTLTIYIRPTYSVVMPTPKPRLSPLSDLQLENMKNLEKRKPDGTLSKKARQRLLNSVNWLCAAAKKKYVWCKESRRRYSFKVNFITLTLPSTDIDISDHFFKSKLLHAFINTCRYRYNLKNYVWRVETQANGNIHVHFTTDSFMPHKGIRKVWNRILEKNGLMDAYRDKHENMSMDEYIVRYRIEGKTNDETLIRRYKQGLADNWSNPNSTDVKAVHKVKDISAYMAKYMSKNDDERRKINGRLWGCSYNISAANKLSVELPVDEDNNILNPLVMGDVKYKQVTTKDKLSGNLIPICDLYFYKLSDWGKKITGRLCEIYKETLFNIRHCIDVDSLLSVPDPIDLRPDHVPVEPTPLQKVDYKQLYLNL